jgi:phospholipid/cholesterol/gamma-HCH transport system substrate-binding protein
MQKQAPSLARILIAVGFTLSCFGLLLFLWITFGGPTPFKPQSYRFTADFPEAVQLAQESDVRIGGVSVGKVKQLGVPTNANSTEATIELQPQFAPLAEDARATLRQKTLLGETYVELTRGSPAAPKIPEGGHLANTQVQDQTQIDEIFNALDPQTRQNFRLWQQNAAVAIKGRGLDLNDALGNLGPFASDAADVLATLRRQDKALGDLVNHTGGVFQALTAHESALSGAIVHSNETFGALASRDKALAETIKAFPDFNRESALTFERLAKFAKNTDPLARDLQPVARDLSPTLKSIRELSPHLKSLFGELGPLLTASKTGLPALQSQLDGLKPVLDALDPFLANFNPIIRYLYYFRSTAADFLSGPGAAIAGTLEPYSGQPASRHFLRQISYLSSESLAVQPERAATNRGNGYVQPLGLTSAASATAGIFPNFDCKKTGVHQNETPPGQIPVSEATEGNAACYVANPYDYSIWNKGLGSRPGSGQAPRVFADG